MLFERLGRIMHAPPHAASTFLPMADFAIHTLQYFLGNKPFVAFHFSLMT